MPEAGEQPLASSVLEQVREVVKKVEAPIDPETLIPQEVGQRAYDRLTSSLASIGVTLHDFDFGGHGNVPLQFAGVPGTFRITLIRHEDVPYPDPTPALRIEWSVDKRKRFGGITTVRETFTLDSTGEGNYYPGSETDLIWLPESRRKKGASLWKKEDGRLEEKKPELLKQKWAEIANTLSESINNPENSTEAIKGRLRRLHGALMAYFENRQIVPKNETVVFSLPESGTQDLLGLEQVSPGIKRAIEDLQQPLIEVGHTYRDIEIPGLSGRWDITFDIDLDRISKAFHADKIFDFIKEKMDKHGRGIILSRVTQVTRPAPNQSKQSVPLVESYSLWRNGDASYSSTELWVGTRGMGWEKEGPRGYIDETWSEVTPKFQNPHLIAMKFAELEQAIANRSQTSPSRP